MASANRMSLLDLLHRFYIILWAKTSSLLSKLFIWMLKLGPIPQHIGFIMDGNRRFAKERRLEKSSSGHLHGYQNLERILELCFKLGIKHVTLYTFSLENFKRSREEVDLIMNLAVKKCEELAKHSKLIKDNRVAIRIIGEISQLPDEVRIAAQSAMDLTKEHGNYVINACFPYTSRAEQLSVFRHFRAESPDPAQFSSLLYTSKSPPLDLLVRTSGENRLSEFLTWQCVESKCRLYFLSVLWPALRLSHLVPVLLNYQCRILYDF